MVDILCVPVIRPCMKHLRTYHSFALLLFDNFVFSFYKEHFNRILPKSFSWCLKNLLMMSFEICT